MTGAPRNRRILSGGLREVLSSRRFRRLLLGYVAVFMLPLILVYFWVVRGMLSEKRAAIEKEMIEKLSLLVQSIDQQIDYANYIAYDVGGNVNLRPAKLQNDVSSLMTGIEELAKYGMNNDFWTDTYYLIEGDPIVYTGMGIMNWEVFLERKIFVDLPEAARLQACIDSIYASPAYGDYVSCYTDRSIFYIISTRRPLVNHRGAVICEVRKDKMLNVANAFDASSYSFFIFDEAGEPLFARNAPSNQRARIDENWFSGKVIPQEMTEIQVEGENYALIGRASSRNGWQFATVVPTRVLLRDALGMQTTVIILLVVICLMGGGLVALFSWKSYAPIQMMRKIAIRQMPELEDMRMDELEVVREMMDRSIAQREDLEESIEWQRKQISRQALRLLLNGFRSEDMYVMLNIMKAAHIVLDRGSMTVFLISRTDGVNPLSEEDMTALLSAFEETPFQIYLCPRAELGALAVLASHEPDEQAYLAYLIYREVEVITSNALISVSNECGEITHLSRALNEAGSAMEYARECSESGVYAYDDIHGAGDSIKELRQAYFHAVRKGDAELALLNVQALIGHVTSSHSYEFGCVVMCELINSLSNIGKEYITEEDLAPQEKIRFAPFDELRSMLVSMTRRVCRAIQARDAAWETSRGNELKRFVEESYREENFSLRLLADHFGMTPNYAGRVFRDETGKGFSDFVSDLRMEYVKKALSDTDEPIKDIVRAAGYQDVPNFMRKFKQFTGITPGEYRKLHRSG